MIIKIKVYKINTYEEVEFTRFYSLPLYKKRAEFHLGSIVHTLLEEIFALGDYIPSTTSNFAKPEYQPAEVQVSFEEKPYYTALGIPEGLISGDLDSFQMAKGHRPFMTESNLALLTVAQQEITRITPKSVISASFTHFGTPQIIVKKNMVVIDDIIMTPFLTGELQKVIFSYYCFVNDFKPGDNIDITIVNGSESRTQRFFVMPEGVNRTYLFFENDNGVIEPFEFSGRRRIFSNYKHITAAKFKELFGYETKVKSKNVQSVIVNTGHLMLTEHKIVDAIIKSQNVWCSFDDPEGPYFLVDASTTKLLHKDSSTTENDFDVEFNLIQDADAVIYPR
jgi:hypothetical protein